VGRRSLLAEVRQRLASSRLVTLVGPGGVGKTRVAVRVMELEQRTFREGCWLASLAALEEPELLCPVVAEALDLRGGDQPWAVVTLADHVADRTALLVLDTCEHLGSAVGDLVEGLRARCPNLRLLLTSRRPLRLSGEDVLVVPPLGLPDESTVATPETITHHEAVTLFVDRATSARSDFRLTQANAPAVAGLCRDLDGIPLAIELAAARIRALSPQDIRDSLAEHVDVLNLGYRDADERHRSLRACIAWSHRLCSPAEGAFWARSSVFVGGFDVASAAVVCAADDLPAPAVLDLVSALVDQSVVVAEEADDGRTRYHMLAEIRRFGLEQAEKEGDLRGLRERHATWGAQLAARFDAEACGPLQRDWLRLLRLERANLRAALEHLATTSEAAAAGLAMARELDLYWSASGWLDEARHWLEAALASGAGTPSQRATSMAVAARFAVLQSDRVRARELLHEGIELATGVGDTRALGLLLVPAAMLAVWDGTPVRGAEQADSAVAMLRDASDLGGELLALFVAGVCHGFAGHDADAAVRHRQCITRADEVGEHHMKALAVAGLGEHELAAGRLDEAAALFRETILLERELDDRMGTAVGLDSLGRVAVAEGRGERAAMLLGAAEAIWDHVGMSETGNPFAFAPSRSDGLRQARSLLGTQRFRELFREGSLLTLDQAVSFALEVTTGAPQPPPGVVEPSPLTRRELEVADLVADGLSNPEIAARLFISVRTAQGHVENILRKLGFSSRSSIAAWVTERRLRSAG
jgi:non-specific serine/threonine protein kinase